MHILILGAGVIGVTTAYELLKTGYKVTVIDRQPEPALETSFGNAGLIAPGHSYAWTLRSYQKIYLNLFLIKRKHSVSNFNGILPCGFGELNFSCNVLAKKWRKIHFENTDLASIRRNVFIN